DDEEVDHVMICVLFYFFFQAEDGIRDRNVTGVQTCALPILNQFPSCFITPTDIRTHSGLKLIYKGRLGRYQEMPIDQHNHEEAEIGRASCRERVKNSEDPRPGEEKKKMVDRE